VDPWFELDKRWADRNSVGKSLHARQSRASGNQIGLCTESIALLESGELTKASKHKDNARVMMTQANLRVANATIRQTDKVSLASRRWVQHGNGINQPHALR